MKIKTHLQLKIGIILTVMLVCFQSLSAQTPNITLPSGRKTISLAFDEIEKQTSMTVAYNDSAIDVNRNFSENVSNLPLREALATILKGTGATFRIQNDRIIIVPEQQTPQNRRYTGSVVDRQGEVVRGAVVSVKENPSVGVLTDNDGNFAIDAPQGSTIVISLVGMESQEISLGERTRLEVTLLEDETMLEDVVVVGYATQRKINLTGAVASISNNDLTSRPVTNLSTALQGLAPGVTVMAGNGRPGDDQSTIRIRGVGTVNNSNPLILIDGLESDTFNMLDPNEIESISVLKDAASAAIYGSKASNGVVLVTTKRGRVGKPTITYSGNVAFENAATLIDRMSSYDYARLYNEVSVANGGAPRFTDEDLRLFRDGSDPYGHPNTNWFDYIYRTGVMHQHNVNATGGTENTRYMVAAGYMGREGILKNSDLSRFNVRTNFDLKFSERFNLRANMSFIHSNRSEPNAAYSGGSDQFVRQADRIAPWIPYKKADGTYGSISDGNPAAWIDLGARIYNLRQNFNGALSLDYSILDNLVFTVQGAYATDFAERKDFRKQIWYDNVNYHGPDQLNERIDRWSRYTFDALLNYNVTFVGDHNLKVMAGYNAEQFDTRRLEAFRRNFPSSETTDLNAGDASTQTNGGYSRELALMSYFGRINYDYRGKYLFEATVRADASSRFARDSRWGYFPSFSAGWRVTEESFMEGARSWLQSLKIRGSWGQLGNQNAIEGDYYPYLPTLTIGKNHPFGGTLAQGITVSGHKVPTISWEKTATWGIGFDATFLDDFTLSAEYYERLTTDMIMSIPVPDTFGISGTYQDNRGSVRNSGVEVSLGWNRKFNDDWRAGATLNFFVNRNRIMNLAHVDEIISGYNINRVGHALDSFYVYEVDGLFQSDEEAAAYQTQYGNPWSFPFKGGDIKILDTNGRDENGKLTGVPDGKLNADDRVIKGTIQPKSEYSLHLTAGWKNLDLSILMTGVSGVNRYYTQEVVGSLIGDTSHPSTNWLDAWSPTNKDSTWPRLYMEQNSVSAPGRVNSSFWCMDADYIRLRNVTLSYTLPRSVTRSLGMANARIYYSGENLLTFDKLPFNADPETGSGDLNVYPLSKRHSFGINITF